MRNRYLLFLFSFLVSYMPFASAIGAQGPSATSMGSDSESTSSATSSPSLTRIRLAPAVEKAQLVHQTMPVYPVEAKLAGVQGTVILHAIIGKDGNIETVELVSGPPLLAQSAMDAVRQWRYKPLLINGRPVEVDTQISVAYTLNDANPSTVPSLPAQQASPSAAASLDIAQEPYVYESVRGIMRYEDDGTGSIETFARIRVQSFAGVQQLGQLIFEYNSDNQRMEIKSVRVIKHDGRVITANSDAVQDLTAPVEIGR